MQVHHRRPLSSLDTTERMSLKGLAHFRAYCHAIIHGNRDCRPRDGRIAVAERP
jgi:predicted HNH restriction endonuclease